MLPRRSIKISFIAVIITAAASCGNVEAPLSADDKVNITNEVTATLGKYYEDIRQRGLLAEFDYLDSSDDFFWVPPGYSGHLSYDSVVAVIRQNAPMLRSVNNRFDTLHVMPLTKELAAYTGRLRSVCTDTADRETETNLVETGTMIKRANGWKLLYGQTGVWAP